MPANLTPQYFEAEQKYREAKTPREKIHALKVMYSVIPKHKGTEKLQADIKRKISKLNEEAEQTRKTGRRHTDMVKKEGRRRLCFWAHPMPGRAA